MAPFAPQISEHPLVVFLLQVLLLLGLARSLGELCGRYGQPRLVGEILVGILIGPTILGRMSPELYLLSFPPEPVQLAMLETRIRHFSVKEYACGGHISFICGPWDGCV